MTLDVVRCQVATLPMATWHLESMLEKQKGGRGLSLTSSFGCLAPKVHVRETKREGGGCCSLRRLVATSL